MNERDPMIEIGKMPVPGVVRDLGPITGTKVDLVATSNLIDALRTRIADLEAACGVLGEECRAWRGTSIPTLVHPRKEISATDAHPVAAGYVKPKETTDGH